SPTRKTYWWAEIQKLSRPPASDHYRVLVTRDGQRLMVVMPHPDDECFGCASTIARYGAEGATVSLVTMTRGGAGLWNGRAAGDLRARRARGRPVAVVTEQAVLPARDQPDRGIAQAAGAATDHEPDFHRRRRGGQAARLRPSSDPDAGVGAITEIRRGPG